MKKTLWVLSIACIFIFALTLPLAAGLADGAPALTLVSPQQTGGAAVDGQKLILQSNMPVTGASDKSITIDTGEGTAVYSAAASVNAPVGGDAQDGPWYYAFVLTSFAAADGAPFSIAGDNTYYVSIPAGAFVSASQTGCADTVFSFTPSATDGSLVTYVLPDATWSVVAVPPDGSARVPVASGTTVDNGTILSFSGTVADGHEPVYAVTMGNAALENPNMTALAVNGNLDAAVTLRQAMLSGNAVIAKSDAPNDAADYIPAYGDTLLGTLKDGNVASDATHLIYTWKRGDTVLNPASANTYVLQPADIGSAIQLEITSSVYSGSLVVSSQTVVKQTVAAPDAPTAASQTTTSVTLNTVDGCEYSNNDGASWQNSPVFDNLTMGQSYSFYQRYQETATAFASGKSAAYSTGTVPALSGTVAIAGTPRVGETLSASVSADSNNTGTLTFVWKNSQGEVGRGVSYSPSTADIGSPLTVEVTSSVQGGMLTAVTAPVAKAATGAPAAPTLASATSSSITLTAIAGCEYSSDNLNWQDSPTFTNLTGGQTYTFYQRFKGTDMRDPSPSSSASFSTSTGLSGAITVSGEVRFGKTLVAAYTGTDITNASNFVWYRGSTVVGYGTAYEVTASDIGYPIYVQLTSATQGNAITKLVGTAQKSDYVGNAPDAPKRESRSTSRITLQLVSGYEYSRDGSSWQSSNVFRGLKAGKTYAFYQRVAATSSMDASPASSALRAATLSESTDDTDDSDETDQTGGDNAGGNDEAPDTGPSGTGALYTYTTSADSTRVLFSTMERLVAGNQTQDITILSGDTQFLFFKGTMKLTDGALWYDFGTEINGAALNATAKELAGDSVVATVHFNHSGELPAKANIRMKLGAEHAGKALYYYRLENGTLVYVQTAIADISGNATVVQSSCSDYVFLDRDFFAPDATPEPTADVSASPSPLAEGAASGSSGKKGWLGVLIIIIALLLIIAGIILYLKSRQSNSFNDFDDDPDTKRRSRRYLSDDSGDDEDDDFGDDDFGGNGFADDGYANGDDGFDESDDPDAYAPYQAPVQDGSYAHRSLYGDPAGDADAGYGAYGQSAAQTGNDAYAQHQPFAPEGYTPRPHDDLPPKPARSAARGAASTGRSTSGSAQSDGTGNKPRYPRTRYRP